MMKERALQTFLTALEQGRWPFDIPMGYKEGPPFLTTVRVKNGGTRMRNRRIMLRTIEICPVGSPIIREALECYATGLWAIRPLAHFISEKYGIKMLQATLERILKSKFYCGIMEYNDVLYPHSYGNIISEDLFNKIQTIKRSRGKKGEKHQVETSSMYHKKLIICGECGSFITGSRAKGKYIYYHCTGSKKKHNGPYLSGKEIDSQLSSLLNNIVPHPDFQKHLEPEINEHFSMFMKSYKDWFAGSEYVDKRKIIDFFFRKLTLENKTIVGRLAAPFNGDNEQDISFADMYHIINNHSMELKKFSPKIAPPIKISSVDKEESTHIPDKILRLCRKPMPIDSLVSYLKIGILEVNEILFDLQLDDKIYQDDNGYWRAK